ncbi:MAG: NYN domain-containing protein [Patescibacteria group bacterium]
MSKKENNYAFIDGQNLYLGVKSLGWKIDYIRFRKYLTEKYSITKAYVFVGFLPTNQQFYSFLQSVGFVLIFKPILENKEGVIKGNCDAELVLQAMIEWQNYERALVVTGDGDFYCLIKHLKDNHKFLKVLAPSLDSCSRLLLRVAGREVSFVNDLRKKVEYSKKRTPQGQNLAGDFSS